jgi:dCMP deaminase
MVRLCGCILFDNELGFCMKQKWLDAFMDTAERFAQLSSSRRLHVGAVVVKDNRIISIGYNGTPAGWDNNCEDKIYCDDGDWSEQQLPKDSNLPWKKFKLVTKDEVIHAEANAIAKLARDGESGSGSTMFCTHAPCVQCAKLIYGAGITKMFYRDSYRDDDGVNFLVKTGVEVIPYKK